MIKVQNHSAVICVALIAFLLLGIIYGNNNAAKAKEHNPEEQKGKQEQEENEKMMTMWMTKIMMIYH
jgi:hypothetical protein